MSAPGRTIDRVTITHRRVPLPGVIEDATQRIDGFEYVVVQLRAGSVTGTGWAYTTGRGGAAIADLVRSCLVTTTLGSEVNDVRRAWRLGRAALDRGGYGDLSALALGAVDIARWDLLARWFDQPLYAVLGGHRRSCPTYGSGVDLHEAPDALATRAASELAAGHHAVKIKLGTDHAANAARLEAVRSRIGDEAELFVDANTSWTTSDVRRAAPALLDAGVAFLEEPLPIEDVDGYRAIAPTCPVPLAGGETAHAAALLAPYVGERLLDVVQPDLCRIGGITEWLRVAAAAEVARLPITTHFTIELASHLAAAVPQVRYVEVTDHNLTHLGVIEAGPQLGPGSITPNDTPGHGVAWRFPPGSVVTETVHP